MQQGVGAVAAPEHEKAVDSMTQGGTETVGGQSGVPRVSPRTGRRRRRASTPTEIAGLWIVAAACGAAAAFLMDAAPTGTDWIDAVERTAFVVVLAVAGGRARRWTLVFGSGLVAATASGPPQLGALAALLIALYLVAVNRRGRVLDALIGGLVGLGALALDVGGPLGLEVLIGVVATAPIAWSAYGYTTRRVQKRWKRGAIALVAAAVVATALAVGAAVLSVTDVQDGVEATRDGVALTGDGERAEATAAFERAVDAFSAAESRIGAPWAGLARAVPVVGHNVRAVQESVALGATLSRSARAVATDVDFESIQRPDGGIDLEQLRTFEPAVQQAATAAQHAGEVLGDLDSPWTVAPLAEQVGELSAEVTSIESQSELALLGVTDGPALLGADAPRRYLVLLGNPAELRDLGGHLGNWAELVIDDGRLELAAVGGPLDLQVAPADVPEWMGSDLPSSLAALQPARFPQNWGGDPDMGTVTRVATAMFEQATGRPVDGVVYADTATFAALVDLAGPVPVPGLPEPFELTAENAEQFLTRDQFVRFERASEGDAALEAVIEDVFGRLTAMQLPSPQRLGATFSPLTGGGHLRLATVHDGDQPLLERLGLGSGFPTADGHDVLSVIQRNAGPSKIDAYLHRDTNVDIAVNEATGDVSSTVEVTLRNDAPAEGLNDLVLANSVGAPYGTNVTDLSVITPFALSSVSVDGVSTGSQPLREDGYWRHTVRVRVPPGGTTQVTFRLAGQVEPGEDYRLDFRGQPIIGENTFSATLSPSAAEPTVTGRTSTILDNKARKLDAGGDYVFTWSPGKR